jgi:hypothetical protein
VVCARGVLGVGVVSPSSIKSLSGRLNRSRCASRASRQLVRVDACMFAIVAARSKILTIRQLSGVGLGLLQLYRVYIV